MSGPRTTSQSTTAAVNYRARSRSPVSRPTTPLRNSSRSSFRNSQNHVASGIGSGSVNALDALEPQFAELSDSIADLEANFMHLQLVHESLSRFGENFASFLYGLNMNAFVVDFPEQPLAESIKRWQKQQRRQQREAAGLGGGDTSTILQSGTNATDTTYMTSDTSFASMKATPRRRTMGGATPSAPPTPRTNNTTLTSTTSSSIGSHPTKRSGIPSSMRGGVANGRAGSRGGTRAGRASGLPRGRGVGAGAGRGSR